jgi:hypothetical protein
MDPNEVSQAEIDQDHLQLRHSVLTVLNLGVLLPEAVKMYWKQGNQLYT